MKKTLRLAAGILAAAIVLVGVAMKVLAQDPLEVAPNIYTKLFENEKVRVCDFKFEPGDAMGTHSHPDHLVYLLSGGKLQLSYADGSTKDIEAKAGDVLWGNAETHATVNNGTTEVHGIIIELKQ